MWGTTPQLTPSTQMMVTYALNYIDKAVYSICALFGMVQ